MFTADQLVAHLVGDYLLQTDWMAREKMRNSVACLVHCVAYTVPFALITQNTWTLLVIAGAHFVIDRWRLTRFYLWARNIPFVRGRRMSDCTDTGYTSDLPDSMSRLLFLVADGTFHILVNGLAIHYLG